MSYYGQLPWLLWFGWFYSWYLVIKRFIVSCKVLSIKEKTSQRKAEKSRSVFGLWRVFEQVWLSSWQAVWILHRRTCTVGHSAASKTEKIPVCKASAGFQGEWQRAEGRGSWGWSTADCMEPCSSHWGTDWAASVFSLHALVSCDHRRRSHSSPPFPSGVSASPRRSRGLLPFPASLKWSCSPTLLCSALCPFLSVSPLRDLTHCHGVNHHF